MIHDGYLRLAGDVMGWLHNLLHASRFELRMNLALPMHGLSNAIYTVPRVGEH